MPIQPIGLATLIIGLLALRFEPRFGITLLLCALLLGSAAALLLPGIGTIQPGHLLLGFVVLKMMMERELRDNAVETLRPSSPGFFLCCLCIFGVLSAIFFPRLFAGQVDVNALSAAEYVEDTFRLPLAPRSGNITQPVYMIGDLFAFIAFSSFAATRGGWQYLTRALLIYAGADIAFAFIDIATTSLKVSWLLNFIRNANYVIFVDSSVGDAMRIIGSFPEASAFAYATVGIACFALRLWLGGVYPRASFVIGLLSTLLLLASTSSTAYLALAVPVALIGAGSVWRSCTGKATKQDAAFLILTPLIAASCLLFVLQDATLFAKIHAYFNDVLFDKSLSASGIDRARLNADAVEVIVKTHLMGAGLGSLRTSTFLLACLANFGLVGAALYALFLLLVFGRKMPAGEPIEQAVRSAAKLACVGLLSAASVSGALVELGPAFFAFAALACADFEGRASRLDASTHDRSRATPTARSCGLQPFHPTAASSRERFSTWLQT